MTLRHITDRAGEWLRGEGPRSDVVISSRVRLARNLAGYPFVSKAGRRQQFEVLERCREQVVSKRLADEVIWVDLSDSPAMDRQLLVERHLISRQHAAGENKTPRAVAIGSDETWAVMVNEEDHMRLQVLRSGMQLGDAYAQAQRIDDVLEEKLDFSFSRRFGYLTACPTNVGTGLRVSVMMHLPGLVISREIEKVKRAARDMHLAVRGLFGEGSEHLGDLFQVSNQTTLGKAEEEILSEFEHTVVPNIIEYENQARQALARQRSALLDDKIWRAWGVLTHARALATDELLQMLSHVRLGVNLGRLTEIDIRTVNELFLLSQPAHLQAVLQEDLDPAARRVARADLVRRKLGGH
ncbi:MAG: protein arginine kinase [Planctomycetota bacterium]